MLIFRGANLDRLCFFECQNDWFRANHAKFAIFFAFDAACIRAGSTAVAHLLRSGLLLGLLLEGLAFASHRSFCLLLNFAVEFLRSLQRELHVSCLFLVSVILADLVQHVLFLLLDACDSASSAQLQQVDHGAERGDG